MTISIYRLRDIFYQVVAKIRIGFSDLTPYYRFDLHHYHYKYLLLRIHFSMSFELEMTTV